MSAHYPSRFRRFLNFVAFRFLPVVLVLAILWTGYGVAQSLTRYLGEQREAQERREIYPQTATALAPTLATHTPAVEGAALQLAGANSGLAFAAYRTVDEQGNAPVPIAQFATNTPPAEEAPAATPPPQDTQPEAPAVTSTLPPAGETRPLPTVMFLGDPDPDQVDVTAIPPRVEPLDRQGNDLLNILLMGDDGEITDDGFLRTDTMIILSVNRTTNSVSMLSLPRDLFVYIPAWGMQRINLAYMRGQSGGWNDGTFELLRQMILYNFGINVHYYAMIDLTGFKEVIDVLGGINIAVDCAIENLRLIGAEVPAAAQRIDEDGNYLLDVGYYHLSGAEALWYARARDNTTDFDRGRRQQQILRAIWRKARDSGQLANLPALWNQGSQLVETNLGFEDVLGLLPLALNLDPGMIENFVLVRTYHTTPWQTPSGDYVQLPMYDTLLPLLVDFYTPPTTSQITLEGAQIRVYNGTAHEQWDRVAAERLGWSGLRAGAYGSADTMDYTDTVLVDYKGGTKGSSRDRIAQILNVKLENIRINPDPDREVDFEVILGSSYNSCTFTPGQ